MGNLYHGNWNYPLRKFILTSADLCRQSGSWVRCHLLHLHFILHIRLT